jgi:hypothetical protein
VYYNRNREEFVKISNQIAHFMLMFIYLTYYLIDK